MYNKVYNLVKYFYLSTPNGYTPELDAQMHHIKNNILFRSSSADTVENTQDAELYGKYCGLYVNKNMNRMVACKRVLSDELPVAANLMQNHFTEYEKLAFWKGFNMKAFNEDLMANTVSVCYWNKDDVCVYVAEGLDDPKHVAAFVEYCRLLELKSPEYADHSIGHLYKVISDFYKYMGNDAFIDVVYTEEYFANTKYTVYEKYIEKLESWENPSLIRIIAEQSMLELIDGIQPEEDRLGVDFIRENMNTNEVYEAEGLTL